MKSTFTTGLMGAGKSKNLIKFFRDEKKDKRAFAVHLTEPTGAEGTIHCRNGDSIKATYLNKDDREGIIVLLTSIFLENPKTKIFIDEVQFLPLMTIMNIVSVSKIFNVTIHFFGLSTTFTGEYFDSSKCLLEVIDKDRILQLTRFCEKEDCRNIAEYNGRIVNGKVSRHGETFVEEKSTYLALCKKHYFL